LIQLVSLKDFIKESLIQISQGLIEANSTLKNDHVQFAPHGFSEQGKHLDVINVDFDILLSAIDNKASAETTSNEFGFNLSVLSAKFGNQDTIDNKLENMQSHRIRFNVQGKFELDKEEHAQQKRNDIVMPIAGSR
jgi:hypothetical protein